MVHERDDEYEGQEDGEYHFSDDQANYEMEPEITPKTAAPSAPKPAPVSGDTPKSFRRPVIGVIVFGLVIFLVYKIISPASNVPTTDFSQTSAASATKSITTRQPAEKTTVVTTTTTAPAHTAVVTPPPVTTVTTVSAPPPVQPAAQSVQQTQVTQSGVQTTVTTQPAGVPQSVGMQQPAPELSSAQASNAIDKLIQLQDQNTKLVTQYQTESAQKIAEYEAQNNEMQGKLQDMALRMNALETTITHLTKALQDSRGGAPLASNSNAGTSGNAAAGSRASEMADAGQAIVMPHPAVMPKNAFSVQAIIPGRAWLKSDTGETVTVAEGDTLKNYGKIIKIDPYDGVVQIDAGGRTVTLSYGATTE